MVNLANHLKSRIDLGWVTLFEVFESVELKIAALDLAAAEGARVRSRTRWAKEGESSTSFFFRLERKNGSQDWIAAMRSDSGQIVSDISGICDSWVDFYSSLFTACPTDPVIQNALLDHLTSKVSVDEVPLCDGLLSSSEVFAAMGGMAKGKSPGSDGLPVEFYIALWNTLGNDLVDVLNASFDSGALSTSQRGALVNLIFKKGDRLDHKNWRPISLLNVDYKICARSLAGRLLKVLHHVVALDQTCGVPGRYIGENVALLRDVVDYASDSDVPVAILSLDQEKAFDRVASFTRWVKLLYTDIRSSVLINGYTSCWFKPTRGVRQGCPLSPLLYILTMEVLAVNIRAHPDITGLMLPGASSPLPVLSLYADDTSVISTSDSATAAAFDTYEKFEKGTGSKLNLGKCEGLWLGSWRGRVGSRFPILWTSVKIKVLGVFLGNGPMDVVNWRPRIEVVINCLNSWRFRSLSLSGKARDQCVGLVQSVVCRFSDRHAGVGSCRIEHHHLQVLLELEARSRCPQGRVSCPRSWRFFRRFHCIQGSLPSCTVDQAFCLDSRWLGPSYDSLFFSSLRC